MSTVGTSAHAVYGGRFQMRIRFDIEVLLVPVDIVVFDQTGDDIDRPFERFRFAEIQEKRLPVAIAVRSGHIAKGYDMVRGEGDGQQEPLLAISLNGFA